MNALIETLAQYGADTSSDGGLRLLADTPEMLSYANLLAARDREQGELNALFGVYEWQGSPLAFLVNGAEVADDDQFRRIRRCIALRGDAPYLGVVRPGQLTIHRVSLDTDGDQASRITGLPKECRTTFSVLANSRPGIAPFKKWISGIILKLLRDAIRDLLEYPAIAPNDAISLAGRALFLRFLGDRDLLPNHLCPPHELFNDFARAKAASQWLDVTFNGDFLPFPDGLLSRLPTEILKPLGNIMYRAADGQLYLGWEEKWAYLDFAHIPVGVLSEAYEHYMREHDKERQRKEGSFYTPRAVADLIVNATFHPLRRDGLAADAKVLDPASGAGVFIVSAFRRLVIERWQRDGRRPDTPVLREILYNQLVGFDINEAALRFAALGLYLMSIELDPEPRPVEKLRFERNLKDTVLHNLNANACDSLGSLGKTVSDLHIGKYDLVIGNPPWPGDTKLPDWYIVKEIVDTIARERLPDQIPPPIPNEVLDLPFIWRAMKWAKPGGQIAFALHARILFQQGNGMVEARAALFKALDITGVINGAELRQTQVWPEIDAPFCLLFARNQLPPHDAAFRFVTPHIEDGLNGAGNMRIDAANAELVTPLQILDRPELLKILFRGTILDLEVMKKMTSDSFVTIVEYWCSRFGLFRGKPKQAGNGYQRICKSSRIRKNGDGLPGISAEYLVDLKELTRDAIKGILVDKLKLKNFEHKRIHDPRSRSLFQKPILLVHKSPPAELGRIRTSVSESDLIYNETYNGYNASGHTNGTKLVRYLALLIGSKPAFWYMLMTSGEFGFEREVVEKIIIDNIPIIPFESLDATNLAKVDELFDAIVQDDSSENWARVDAWAASLYGLNEKDLQVIDDTLRYNLPFAANKRAAQKVPSREEVTEFCNTLTNELDPWAKREGLQIKVQLMPLPTTSPWSVLSISATAVSSEKRTTTTDDWLGILQLADRLASTEVILPDPGSNSLSIARFNQGRYWSCSQAKLTARRIVWEHLDTLFGSEA